MTPLEDALLDLVAVLAAAAGSAQDELAQLTETPMPMPDGLHGKLEERGMLLATLKRVSTDGGAAKLADARTPEEVRAFITAVFREERSRGSEVDDSMPRWPVMDHVERELADAIDTVRRARLLVPELYEAVLAWG